MSDRRLRELERQWHETGSLELRRSYDMARVRAGLPKLPREVIRHYVAEASHGCCDANGKIDRELPGRLASGRWGRFPPDDRVSASCGAELWPRNLLAEHQGLPKEQHTYRKEIFYTEDLDEVTCKSCLRSANKLPDGVKRRTHYAPGSRYGKNQAAPVCSRDDSGKFDESYVWDLRNSPSITCPACKRIMERGRRAPRRPRS